MDYFPLMSIWILAIGLFVLLAVLGYLQGVIRLGVSLIGLMLGVVLAGPLTPLIKPLMPRLGVKSYIWEAALPPVMVLLLVYLVFIGISFLVHRKVELFYKYRADDLTRYRFERLNKRLGFVGGLFAACIWFYLVGIIIYSVGHLTTQLASDDTQLTSVRLLNQAKRDLHTAGLDRSMAAFDPLPKRFYETADVLGLIRNNPIVVSRLAQYPAFLFLGERTEFQDIATDADLNTLIQSKGDLADIIKNPKMQTILQNREVMQELLSQDLADLREFLETGKSPKFDDETVLGRWELDFYATSVYERKRRPNMSASQMLRLRKIMTEMLPKVTILASPDKKVKVKVEMTDSMKKLAEAAAAAAAARAQQQQQQQQFGGPPGMSPELAARYGRVAPRPGEGQPAPAQAPKPANATQLVYAAEGTWEQVGNSYQFSVTDEQNQQEQLPVVAEEERLLVKTPEITMVFYKQ